MIARIILIIFFLWCFPEAGGPAAEDDFPGLSVDFKQNIVTIRAREVPLEKLLDEIARECGIKIRGFDEREKEAITFFSDGCTPSQTLRRLVSHLGEGNYVFEFHDQELVSVRVFPNGEAVAASRPVPKRTEKAVKEPPPATEQKTKQEFVKIPRILNVNDDSQAQAVGLLKGDLIVEYDGVRISSSAQLVSEVKKKADSEEVEIVVIRDKTEMRFSLEGGEIGVGVGDEEIPKEEFDKYSK